MRISHIHTCVHTYVRTCFTCCVRYCFHSLRFISCGCNSFSSRLPEQVKDKLIFEQQKMDAFEKRKARFEQRKYAKELSSAKQAEKSKRKREELEQIEEWKKSTKRARCVPSPSWQRTDLWSYLTPNGGCRFRALPLSSIRLKRLLSH